MIRKSMAMASLVLACAALSLPVYAGGDGDGPAIDIANPKLDDAPLGADQVEAAEAAVETGAATTQGGAVDPNNPPIEVRIEVKIHLDALAREREAIQREYEEMKRLREEDRAEYDRRMAALEEELVNEKIDNTRDEVARARENGGMSGIISDQVNAPINDVVDGTAEMDAAGPTEEIVDPGVGPEGAPEAGTSDNTAENPDAEVALPPATDADAGLPSAQPEEAPTWWEKLLTKAVEGLGKALAKWVKNELGKLRDKAAAYAADTAADHPAWKRWIADTFANGVDDILAGKYNAAILGLVDKVTGNGGDAATTGGELPAPPALPDETGGVMTVPGVENAPQLDPIPPAPVAPRDAEGNPVINVPVG